MVLRFIRSAAVRLGSRALYRSGALNLLPSWDQARAGESAVSPFAVLLYHRVNSDADPFFPSLSVDAFDLQMRYLAERFRVLSLTEILDGVEQGEGVEPRTVAITFDDGYRDNYLFARPVLAKYRLPAAIFIATGFIGNGRMMWNDRIADAIKHTSRTTLRVESPSISIRLPLHSNKQKLDGLSFLLERLKDLSDSEKAEFVERLVEELPVKNKTRPSAMLGWEEVRELAAGGWEIGSHTVEHSILTRIEERAARRELSESKRTLEGELQRPVTLFAYPNGKPSDLNSVTGTWVRQSGYRAALTTVDGLNSSELDFFAIRRFSPWEEDLPRFAVRLQWLFWNATKKSRRWSFARGDHI